MNDRGDRVSSDQPCYCRGAVDRDGRIQPGDVVLAVNGRQLEGMSKKQAVGWVRDSARNSR